MPAKIRLKRVGRKKQSSFRIVVTERSESVTGAPIEQLGIYKPRTEPSVLKLDAERSLHWLRTGANPSDTVRSLFQRAGLWEKFHDGVTPEELTEKQIFLGPEGAWKTSRRAETAAAAREAAEEAAAEAEEAAAATATEAPPEEAEEAPEAEEEPAAEGDVEVEAEAEEEPEAAEEAEEPAAEAAVDAPEAEAEEEEEPEAGEEAEEPVAEAAAEVGEEEEDEDEDEETKEG